MRAAASLTPLPSGSQASCKTYKLDPSFCCDPKIHHISYWKLGYLRMAHRTTERARMQTGIILCGLLQNHGQHGTPGVMLSLFVRQQGGQNGQVPEGATCPAAAADSEPPLSAQRQQAHTLGACGVALQHASMTGAWIQGCCCSRVLRAARQGGHRPHWTLRRQEGGHRQEPRRGHFFQALRPCASGRAQQGAP